MSVATDNGTAATYLREGDTFVIVAKPKAMPFDAALEAALTANLEAMRADKEARKKERTEAIEERQRALDAERAALAAEYGDAPDKPPPPKRWSGEGSLRKRSPMADLIFSEIRAGRNTHATLLPAYKTLCRAEHPSAALATYLSWLIQHGNLRRKENGEFEVLTTMR